MNRDYFKLASGQVVRAKVRDHRMMPTDPRTHVAASRTPVRDNAVYSGNRHSFIDAARDPMGMINVVGDQRGKGFDRACLLYTSDAAGEGLGGDPAGRRNTKKKNTPTPMPPL